MSVDVFEERIIARPRSEVASYAADPDRAPDWYVNIRSVAWKTTRPLRVDAQVAFEAHFLGMTMAYTYRIVEYEAQRRLVMRTSEGPFPMETEYTWEDVGDGSTRMGLRNRGEPRGFSWFMQPLMVPAMRRSMRNDLARLASILEGQ